mmetsp:Transcript_31976/g.54558  ORF Transcript_31976/g.54558 Transcript_31976/m.54558 type:complete len:125 (+) Transcript_31976:621-995(+)
MGHNQYHGRTTHGKCPDQLQPSGRNITVGKSSAEKGDPSVTIIPLIVVDTIPTSSPEDDNLYHADQQRLRLFSNNSYSVASGTTNHLVRTSDDGGSVTTFGTFTTAGRGGRERINSADINSGWG